MSETVYLVACCGPKLAYRAPAAELYVSDLFQKAKAYAERRGPWYVLSAKHGLLWPTTPVLPYDQTLQAMSPAARQCWGRIVRNQLEFLDLAARPLVVLAGAAYVQPLLAAGLSVTQPMQGLGIGRQLQWLKRQLAD